MTVKSSDAAARAAQEAARRAAEAARKAAEAARKAAAEAARKAADAAAQKSKAASTAQQARAQLAQKAGTRPTASAVRQAFGKNEFSTGLARAMKQRLGLTPPATNLHTEVLGDGKANCLERAVRTAKPGDQVVLLADRQDSVGHAVVERPDGTVVDPNRPKPYPSLDAYLRENPRYNSPARVSDVVAEQILRSPPGALREALIAKAGLTDAAARVVADPGHITAQYQREASEAATRAQSAWDRTISSGGSELEAASAAAQVLEEAAASKSDPMFRTYVARAAVGLADKLGRAVGAASGSATNSDAFSATLAQVSKFAEAGDAGFTQALASSMATAMPDRAPMGPSRGRAGDALNELKRFLGAQAGDGNVDLATALGVELGRLGKTEALEIVTPMVRAALDRVQDRYDETQGKYLEAEAQLGVELQRFGPAMTDAQKKDYVEAFWAEPANAATRRDFATAETELANGFEAAAPALEAAARGGDGDAAAQLVRGAKELATTQTHADVALDFVERLGRAENKPLFDALNTDGKLEDTVANEILAPALGNAQAAALAGKGVDIDGIVATLKLIKSNGSNFKKLASQISLVTQQYDKVKQLLAAGSSSAEISQALRLDDLTRGWEGKSNFGKALAVFGVVGAMGAAISADGNLDRIQASLSAVRGGLELGAGVLSALGRAGKLAEGGARAASFLSKLAPGIGLVVDSIQLYKDIETLRQGGNVGDWISTFGTVLNLAGDVAGFIPVAGQVVDGALTAVGTVVQGVGGLVSMVINGQEEAQENRAEIDARLRAAGLDEHTREVLLTERSIDATSIAALGLEGQAYLRALEATEPMSSDDSYAIEASQKGWHLAAAYGLSGDTALRFVQDFRERYGNVQGFQTLQLLGPALERVTMSAAMLAREGRSSDEIARELEREFEDLDSQLRDFLPDIAGQYLGGGAHPVPGFYQPQFLNLPN